MWQVQDSFLPSFLASLLVAHTHVLPLLFKSYSEVSLTELNGTYSKVRVYNISTFSQVRCGRSTAGSVQHSFLHHGQPDDSILLFALSRSYREPCRELCGAPPSR